MTWYVVPDEPNEDKEACIYTVTTNPQYPGWNTDSGYEGYGIPYELALWMAKKLNECKETPPYKMKGRVWRKTNKSKID